MSKYDIDSIGSASLMTADILYSLHLARFIMGLAAGFGN